MEAYAAALARTDELPLFTTGLELRSPQGGLRDKEGSLSLRASVRLFVESHVHRKLRDIVRALVRYEQAYATEVSADEELAEWLSQARENADEFSSTLSTWKRTVKGLWGLVTGQIAAILLGLIVAQSGAKSLSDLLGGVDHLRWAGIAFFPIVYTAIFIGTSFGLKRRLLLTTDAEFERAGRHVVLRTGKAIDKRPLPGLYRVSESVPEGAGVYGREERLYKALRARKRREFPFGNFMELLSALLFASLCVVWTVYVFEEVGEPPDNLTTGEALKLAIPAGVAFVALVVWGLVRFVDGYRGPR